MKTRLFLVEFDLPTLETLKKNYLLEERAFYQRLMAKRATKFSQQVRLLYLLINTITFVVIVVIIFYYLIIG